MLVEHPLALLSRDQGTVIDALQSSKYPSAKPQDCLASRNFILSSRKTDKNKKDRMEIVKASFVCSVTRIKTRLASRTRQVKRM